MAIKFSDITGGGIPYGNTAGRPASPTTGKLYSNGEAARLELYTATGWQNIVQEVPGVASITGNYSEATNSGTITIAGTNFVSGAIASAIGTNGASGTDGSNGTNGVDGFIYETTDGNSIAAEALDSYELLMRNSDNTGYTFVTLADLKMISDSHPLTFIDTKKPLGPEMSGFTFIKINEVEWENCKGQTYEMWSDKLIVTMSERGAMYDGVTYPVNNDIEVRDLSGAGDTFMAALVVSYLKTKSIEVSIEYANDCATKVVQKRGVVTL